MRQGISFIVFFAALSCFQAPRLPIDSGSPQGQISAAALNEVLAQTEGNNTAAVFSAPSSTPVPGSYAFPVTITLASDGADWICYEDQDSDITCDKDSMDTANRCGPLPGEVDFEYSSPLSMGSLGQGTFSIFVIGCKSDGTSSPVQELIFTETGGA